MLYEIYIYIYWQMLYSPIKLLVDAIMYQNVGWLQSIHVLIV